MEIPVKQVRKLLSLDGGGVRGMSAIAILRELMEKLARKRGVEVVHPWQEFDMIGGTSTGGLLAIMLGRLRMSIDECEEAYMKFSEDIFKPRNAVVGAYNLLNAQGKFSTEALEANIKELIDKAELPQSEKFDDKRDDSCKTFVSVVRQEDGANTVLRSYINPEMPNPMRRFCMIWQAARATSAASTFFEPITIGPNEQMFVDGALGFNNPIQLLERESRDLWPDEDRIFLSIGTGSAPGGSLEGNFFTLAARLSKMLLETEKTADGFMRDNPHLVAAHQYYRFNVSGLGHVGLEEYKARPQIYTATETYLETMEVVTKVKQCISTLSLQKTPPGKVYERNTGSYTNTGAHQNGIRPAQSSVPHQSDGPQQRPAQRLPFNVRQSLKSEFEDKKREVEERFSTLLGTPWTINPKIDAIYPYIPKNYHGNAGAIILRYFEGTYNWLKIAIEHQGFDGLRDELNETCFHHMITLEPLEPDDEDKTLTKTGAGGCRVGKGFLSLLFEKKMFGQSVNLTTGLVEALSLV